MKLLKLKAKVATRQAKATATAKETKLKHKAAKSSNNKIAATFWAVIRGVAGYVRQVKTAKNCHTGKSDAHKLPKNELTPF